jgi:hypothetical protein
MGAVAEVWTRWGHVLLACALGAPAAVLLIAWRARRGLGWRAALAEVGAVAGTLPWLWMLFTPVGTDGAVEAVPLRGLGRMLVGDGATAVVQIGGNLLCSRRSASARRSAGGSASQPSRRWRRPRR